MHAMVGRVRLREGVTPEEGERNWREHLLPAMKQQKGFRGVAVMYRVEEHQGMSISLWDSEQDAQAARSSSAVQAAMPRMLELLQGPPAFESWQVGLLEGFQ